MRETQEEPSETAPFTSTLARLLRLLGPYKWPVIGGNLLMLVATACEFVNCSLLGDTINHVKALYVAGELSPGDAFAMIWPFPAAFAAVYIIRLVAYLRGIIIQRNCNMALLGDIRRQFYDYTQKLAFSFHDSEHPGKVITRFTGDLVQMNQFFIAVLQEVTISTLCFIVAPVLLVMISWKLAVLSLATAPIAFIYLYKKLPKQAVLERQVRSSFEGLTSTLKENIAGQLVVKAFAMEDHERERFAGASEEYLHAIDRSVRYRMRTGPVASLIFNVATPVVWLAGGLMAIQGTMEIGLVLKATLYLGIILRSIRALIAAIFQTQASVISAERVFEIFDATSDVRQLPVAVSLPEGPGRVEFRHLWFAYRPDNYVLKDINLVVEPGQMFAIVGPTGSGKSTLVQLIPRFYEATKGSILVDGCDIQEITLDSLRSAISIVFQDTYIFSATVRENIAYARPDAPSEEIVTCAKAAEAHEFITGLEKGYDTFIGESGSTLPGGQKQRVAIARALLKDPRILLLDDSTAAVDPKTETLIRKAVQQLIKGRTTFVIAHRLSTVVAADKIIVMDEGEVVETGTHTELLAEGGLYSDIHARQFGREKAP